MRWYELAETVQLSYDDACRIIADDDELYAAIIAYKVNFESGIADDVTMRERLLGILQRMKPRAFGGLFRGECREYWRESFGRGFHSWSVSHYTATQFARSCSMHGLVLTIQQPVRAVRLNDLYNEREKLRGERAHDDQQSEVLVLDSDALLTAREATSDDAVGHYQG